MVKLFEDGEATAKKRNGRNALKVLREIRPGVVVAEKHVHGVPPGTYVASTVVDGKEFEGRGSSLSLAKSLAAEVAVSTLFNIEFERTAGIESSFGSDCCLMFYLFTVANWKCIFITCKHRWQIQQGPHTRDLINPCDFIQLTLFFKSVKIFTIVQRGKIVVVD